MVTMYTISQTVTMSPSKNIILGLKIKTFDLIQTKLSGASHQLSRLQLIAAVQHMIQLEQIN